MFNEGGDNDKIKHIYGNFNFWSWFRYWYIDSTNYTNFILMDKGYYDYDYKPLSSLPRFNDLIEESEEETKAAWGNFDLSQYKKNKKKNIADMSADELAGTIKL